MPGEQKTMLPLIAFRKKYKRGAAEALRDGDFEGVLMLEDGPTKLKAFKKIEARLSDDEYWQYLRDAWSCSMVTMIDRHKWLCLFNSKRPGREMLMTPEENQKLASMPDEVNIWRGCGHHFAARGMSWTAEEWLATHLAKMACYTQRSFRKKSLAEFPIIVAGTVQKNNIIAYFNDSYKREIVVDPKDVKLHYAEKVKIAPLN
jgi:hypothetical protein